jgi:hypothetical protein
MQKNNPFLVIYSITSKKAVKGDETHYRFSLLFSRFFRKLNIRAE